MKGRSVRRLVLTALALFVARSESLDAQSARLETSAPKSEDGVLVGPLTRADLQASPFADWFQSRYKDYRTTPAEIEQLRGRLANVSIEAYFGTWCGDSRRQIPRLLRVLDDAGFDERRLSLYGLSNQANQFKQSPGRQEAKRRIHRTPTIVLVRDGKEIGRVVETPEGTLEADVLRIVNGQGPAPKYGAEALVNDIFIDTPASGFEAALQAATPAIEARSDPDSLWHYAEFDLLRNGRPAEARAVLELHLKSHPRSVQGHVLMGEALSALGRKAEALASVERALAIEPNNGRAKSLAESLRK